MQPWAIGTGLIAANDSQSFALCQFGSILPIRETALAELSTRQIAENSDATGMEENESAAKSWWPHREACATGAGEQDGEGSRQRRKLFAAVWQESAEQKNDHTDH